MTLEEAKKSIRKLDREYYPKALLKCIAEGYACVINMELEHGKEKEKCPYPDRDENVKTSYGSWTSRHKAWLHGCWCAYSKLESTAFDTTLAGLPLRPARVCYRFLNDPFKYRDWSKEQMQEHIKKLVLDGSICIFPAENPQRMRNLGKVAFGQLCAWLDIPMPGRRGVPRMMNCPHCSKSFFV